VEFFFKKQACW